MIEVRVTDEFDTWYVNLSEPEQESIRVVVKMLVEAGIALPYPYSSSIRGSKHGFRELRPKRGKSPLRVFYAFDPAREAVLIFGGTKEKKLYTTVLARTEEIWVQYLREFARRGKRA